MKNVLILSDFSENAYTAAEYVSKLASAWGIEKVILYNTYELVPTVGNEPIVMSNTELLEERRSDLLDWETELRPSFPPSVVWKTVIEDYELAFGVSQICKQESIDLVVLGTGGKSGFTKLILGSNTLKLIENGETPLLIVPATIPLKTPEKILIASNLKEIEVKLNYLFALAANLLPDVHVDVIHVTKEDPSDKPILHAIEVMKGKLAPYRPAYSFIQTSDIAGGINQLVEAKQIDLLITFHRHKGMLSRIFSSSIAQKMAWKSHTAMLVIPIPADA